MESSLSREELELFRPGIYLHYKGHLYEADHLTHNASTDDRIEIHYVSLQLEGAQEGPRHATREFREFLFDQIHKDGTQCEHDDEPDRTGHYYQCWDGKRVYRFRYLGPVFEAWMLEADPWSQ